jgi:hypothetical protein
MMLEAVLQSEPYIELLVFEMPFNFLKAYGKSENMEFSENIDNHL